MAIDFDDGFIDPDSQYAENIRTNLAMGDESGIFIGNCYYTHEMIEKQKEKESKKTKSDSSSIGFDPFFDI